MQLHIYIYFFSFLTIDLPHYFMHKNIKIQCIKIQLPKNEKFM